MYELTEYSFNRARQLGVDIKPSTNKNKKIDVFKGDKKVASVGAIGYKDYPTYIREKGKKYADERRALYKARHNKDRTIKGSPGWFADKILW